MWTRLVSAMAAVAAAVAVGWLALHDEARAMGEVSVLVVANPPSGSDQEATKGVTGSLHHDACTGLSPALSPAQVEWSSATQPNGVRACRWLKTWRVADLARQSLPGEPHVLVRDGVIAVTLDPLPPDHRVGVTTIEVTLTFPGEVLAFSGAGSVSGSAVTWSNPVDFFSGVDISASGRDRPLLIGLLPWLAGVLALIALGAAVPRSRGGREARARSARDADRAEPTAVGEPASGPTSDDTPELVAARPPAAPATPAGPDPTSPWRPPSPQ